MSYVILSAAFRGFWEVARFFTEGAYWLEDRVHAATDAVAALRWSRRGITVGAIVERRHTRGSREILCVRGALPPGDRCVANLLYLANGSALTCAPTPGVPLQVGTYDPATLRVVRFLLFVSV